MLATCYSHSGVKQCTQPPTFETALAPKSLAGRLPLNASRTKCRVSRIFSHLEPLLTFLHMTRYPAKFEAKAQKFIVIGYDTNNKRTYRLYDGRSVIVRTDVIINHQEPQSPVAEPKEEPVRTKTISVADDPETETAAQKTHADIEEQSQSNIRDISSSGGANEIEPLDESNREATHDRRYPDRDRRQPDRWSPHSTSCLSYC
jgi:hypothetical protein